MIKHSTAALLAAALLLNQVAHAEGTRIGDWLLIDQADEFTDSHLVAASTPSRDSVSKYGKSQLLTARCKDGELSLMLNWNEFISNKGSWDTGKVLEARVDKNPPKQYGYGISSSFQTTFVGDERPTSVTVNQYYELIDEMKNGEDVIFRIQPYGESPRVAKFSLNGFSDAYQTVFKCYEDTRKK